MVAYTTEPTYTTQFNNSDDCVYEFLITVEHFSFCLKYITPVNQYNRSTQSSSIIATIAYTKESQYMTWFNNSDGSVYDSKNGSW